MTDIDALAKKYGEPEAFAAGSNAVDVDTLASRYGGSSITPPPSKAKPERTTDTAIENMGRAAIQGGVDVINAGASAIGTIHQTVDRLFKTDTGSKELNAKLKTRIAAENAAIEGMDSTAANVSRIGGQIAATAPLVPARAIQGAMGALPTINAVGQKIAAPLINRLGAAVGTGGVGGGIFGAGTSTTDDSSLASHVGSGIITGAIAGPVITAGGALGTKAVEGLKNLWTYVNISKLSRASGLEPSAVKNIIQRLEDAGHTPQSAQAELTRLGPKATLMDLDASLAAEGGGLASFGGKPTSIIKNRVATRAETANSDVVKNIEAKLGPRLEIEAEKNAVHKEAQRLTSGDYKAAHADTQKLDVSNIVGIIDNSLKNAVGEKASLLKEAKGYLFRETKDAQGNVTKTLKDDIASLHEVRQELDSVIGKAKNPQTSAGKNALSAIKNVRDKLDTVLKTNSKIVAADTKFAKKMKVKDAIQTGYDALVKGKNRDEFAKIFDNATPEMQEGIKRGMRAAISHLTDKASQGELTGALNLFGKKSVNRANFQKAFGSTADDVMDELAREGSFRGVERGIASRSHTAEGQAIQRRYGERNDKGSSITGETIKGAVLDVISGTPGAATIMMAGKRAAGQTGVKISENRLGRLVEGTADIISRSGAERDAAMSVVSRVKTIEDKSAKQGRLRGIKLPVTTAAPVGEEGYGKIKEKFGNWY